MKQKLLCGLMALVLGPAALSQTYENWALVQCPPEIPPTIDAFNFINHAQFFVNFTNGNLLTLPVATPPYETSSTLNYTNDFGAVMSCNTGFRMETYSLQSGQRQRASSLYNNGTIDCGTLGTSNVIFIGGFLFNLTGTGSGIKCLVNASNIYNPGTINMGFDSLLSLRAESIDLTHGTLAMENSLFNGINGLFLFNAISFDGYWGLGDPFTQRPLFYPLGINPDSDYSPPPPFFPTTQIHIVTNRNYTITEQQLGGGSNFVSYLLDVTDLSGSNRTVRAVFVSSTNLAITTKVYLQSFYPFATDPDVVEFSSIITNAQGITTNFIYLQDSFLTFTNFQVLQDGFAGVGINRPTFIPENYSFSTLSPFFFGGPPTPATRTNIPPGTFAAGGNGNVTNQWTAYQAIFQPGSVVAGDVAGQNVTNEPGRIELAADNYLTLPQAQISSVNYILLKATNQFGGSSGAQIAAPFADLYLRDTNGLLSITNVLMPELPRPIGICDLFSARWTNVVAGITNRYHVLFVDAQFAPTSPLMVQTLDLRATNAATHDDSIFISDVFNVTSNLLIDTRRLTLTTNAPGSPAPAGVLNYLNPGILWPASTPRLRYLTNYGIIESQNLAVFGGSQTSPYSSPASSTNPYAAFVNAGSVTNFGSFIFASYFQNSGTFFASGGAIHLLQAQAAVLTNGAFLAAGTAGTITIQGGSLLVSNHVLQAGNALTLSITNFLDDGSLSNSVDFIINKNTWTAGGGINLWLLPTNGASLLATTITNNASTNSQVANYWAGRDDGCWPSGFVNNAALGRLILDGQDARSLFSFFRIGLTNALYVDLLELKDATTNADSVGHFVGVSLQTNFTIYYGDAIANGESIAYQLNGRYGLTGTNGGRFCWVSNYNTGFFSSTNLTYTDGSGTHRLNRALVTSCNLDSNGNGIPNCTDPNPVPVLTPSTLVLRAVVTNGPPRAVVLSWNTIPLVSNYLYAASSLPTTNWQPVTNFLSDATIGGRMTVTYPIGTNRALYYHVRVLSP